MKLFKAVLLVRENLDLLSELDNPPVDLDEMVEVYPHYFIYCLTEDDVPYRVVRIEYFLENYEVLMQHGDFCFVKEV